MSLVFGDASSWAGLVRAAGLAEPARAAGSQTLVREPRAWLREARSGASRQELGQLTEVMALLGVARARAAELDEAAALRALWRARTLAESSLVVPGAATFLAEVELQLAVTAQQAGHDALARASLERAVRLDPRRTLLAAEASPEVVALATREYGKARSAPEGELALSVDAEGARVFLDDEAIGTAPQRVRTIVGTHALRVEAEGRLPYAALIVVHEGQRPALRVRLAEDPAFTALAALTSASERADASALRASLSQLQSFVPAATRVVVAQHDARAGRQVWVRCDAARCALLRQQDGHLVSCTDAFTPAELALAEAWLRDRSGAVANSEATSESVSGSRTDASPAKPWWQRWYVWSAAAVLVAGASTALAFALEPEPEHELRVTVDTGRVAP